MLQVNINGETDNRLSIDGCQGRKGTMQVMSILVRRHQARPGATYVERAYSQRVVTSRILTTHGVAIQALAIELKAALSCATFPHSDDVLRRRGKPGEVLWVNPAGLENFPDDERLLDHGGCTVDGWRRKLSNHDDPAVGEGRVSPGAPASIIS